MWFLHQEIISKTDAYNLFLWVSLCCSFSNVCTTLEFGGILLAPVRQLSSIFLRVVTFPELSRGRGRSQNKSRLKHQNHIYFCNICPKRISVKHLETNCSNCLHKWFSNRPVPQAISGRLHEINSQTGWLALIVFTLSISLYSPMFTICSVNFEQLGPNRVLEKLDFGAHCTALLKPLEKQRRAQFCRNQGIYVPCRYESSQ